jgi:hypothetical protein
MTALSSAVIGPVLAARHDRLTEQAGRLRKAIDECREPLTAWTGAATDAAVDAKASRANHPELADALREALNAFITVNDDVLRSAVTTAQGKIGHGSFVAAWVTYQAAKGNHLPEQALDEVARVATDADLAVRDVWDRALNLADPPSLSRRLMRRMKAHRAPSRDEQVEQGVKALKGTREMAIRLKSVERKG